MVTKKSLLSPIFLIIYLLLTCTINAQENILTTGYLEKHYTKEDGMAGANGYLLYGDKLGFLWIASFEGLSRFDGRSFTTFGQNDDLGENNITDICEDNNSCLYVATSSKILRYYMLSARSFLPYKFNLSQYDIFKIAAIDSNHIYFSDNKSGQAYLLENKHINNIKGFYGHALDMQIDCNGYLYIMTYEKKIFAIKGTQVINNATEPSHIEIDKKAPLMPRLKKDANGNVYYKAMKGIFLLNGNSHLLQPYQQPLNNKAYYNLAILLNKTGTVYRWNNQQWIKSFPLVSKPNSNSDIYVAPNGNLWYVSDDGLTYYYPKKYTSLPNNLLLNYFITTASGQRAFIHDSSLYKTPIVQLYAKKLKAILLRLYVGRDKTIWFCTNNGVYYLLNGRGPIKYYTLPIIPERRAEVLFRFAFEDNKGTVWFETYDGVVCYKKGKFELHDVGDGREDDAIYCTAMDKKGIVYTAGRDVFEWQNGQPIPINDQLGIGHNITPAMDLDKDGNLWICPYSSKLLKIGTDGKGKFFVADSLLLNRDGINLVAQHIVFDSGGNLWVSSYKQLTLYIRQRNGRFTNLNKIVIGQDQQLPQATIGKNRLFADTLRQHIYLVTDTLIAMFDVNKVLESQYEKAPDMQMTDILIFKQKIDWHTLGEPTNKYGLPTHPTLKSDQNFISFHFTGVVDNDPKAVVYQYKLQGYDTSWRPITKLGEVDYTNLSPGSYTFFIKGGNIHGVWSSPKALSFSIQYPWYRTWAAWILWWTLFISAKVLLYKLIKKSSKKRERLKRLVVEEQLKTLRAQINPHLLQNTFEFLLQSLHENPLEYTEQLIVQLSSYLRKVLEKSNETLVSMEDELAFAEEYLAINQLLFPNSFTHTIYIDDDVDIFAVKLPSMLLQPILENAIKHSIRHSKNEHASIKIKIHADKTFVYCSIENTAFYKAQTTRLGYKPQGLAITEKRLALLYKDSRSPPAITAYLTKSSYQVVIKIPQLFMPTIKKYPINKSNIIKTNSLKK